MMVANLEAPLKRRRRKETGKKGPALRLSEAVLSRKDNSGPAPEVARKVNFALGRRKARRVASPLADAPAPSASENWRSERICRGRLFRSLESG